MDWIRQGTKRDLYSKQLNLNLLKQIPDEFNSDNGAPNKRKMKKQKYLTENFHQANHWV